MLNFSRRQFLGAAAASVAAGALSGCATGNKKTAENRLAPPANAQLQLLFYADTHAQWQSVYAHPAANHLGPMSLLGQPPYLTENSRLAALGLHNNPVAAAWLTAEGARNQAQAFKIKQPNKMGGYAVLAQALAEKRTAFGVDASLTLEGGQCWNGSGLSTLTDGRYGPLSSHWLGADVKITSEEAVLWPKNLAQLYSDFKRPVLTAEQPISYFTKAGVNIAVVGSVNPWQQFPQGFDEQQWLAGLQLQVTKAAQSASLVILLCDAGTNPSLWLSTQLDGVDVILSSRGQDLWPQPVRVESNSGKAIPVCFAGSQGQGFAELTLLANGDTWQLAMQFHPLFTDVEPATTAVTQQITQLRSAYAGWLDQPLAKAPDWLYRRDVLAGSWDQIIAEALKSMGAELTLAPGLRHGLALPPAATITRDHLLSLTAGYSATLFNVPANRSELQSRLEVGADQLLSDDWFLHTSEDLPRLTGSHFVLRYQALAGQRISELEWPAAATSEQVRVAGWSTHYQGEGVALWQLVENWLRERPENWQLPAIEQPSLAFVDGHPGWHPEALL